MKFICLPIFSCLFSLTTSSQLPADGGNRSGGRSFGNMQMNTGRFYGKLVETKSSKGIDGVTIQLKGNKFDSVTKQLQEYIIATVITEPNGDFNIENVPVIGNFKLKASAIGYKNIEKKISFGIKFPQGGGTPDSKTLQQMMSLTDKDLGNIPMDIDVTDLGNVTVSTSAKQQFELAIDRKIFNVDKSFTAAGQTATELMRSIPSLSVDIDGNVSLRNATPTIFIDGRPTTLTLDQIPVDIIDKVEIITNPSAKFDASGGNAGILNIVLKSNRKNGYNGSLRAGIDSRGRVNTGADLNLRQNKINLTLSANLNQRKSIGVTIVNTTLFTNPDTLIYSKDNQVNLGYFGFIRGGFDYFIDNRNTITINANYSRANFKTDGLQAIDTGANFLISNSDRSTFSEFNNKNFGGQFSYKHNFPKVGHNLSGDINYNSSKNTRDFNNSTTSFDATGTQKGNSFLQKSEGKGLNNFFTIQTDYENLIKLESKFEGGLRAAIRNFESENYQYVFDYFSTNSYIINPRASNRYKYTDAVYAAYSTYSFKSKKTSFQLGLRIESSNYKGKLQTLAGADSTEFSIKYPISLFPSAFITHKINDKEDLQINYSRRVNRPNFFQLLPSFDFSDPQNPSVGNPGLNPEFTHSFEFSYNNAYKKNANFLATAYFKYSDNLITRYIYKDINRNIKNATDSLYYGSYINANNSYTYGLELTNKMPVTKWWDLMINFNLYNTQINAVIPNQTIDNSLVSWFSKVNTTFKLSKGLTLQLTWESRSKTIIPQGGGGGRMFGGGTQTSAQGFVLPRWFDVDASIRKEWTWKNGRTASINISMNDLFRNSIQSEVNAFYFSQNTFRLRDPQVLRINFNYKFGKTDATLFKRKNTKAEQSGGMEMMGQ